MSLSTSPLDVSPVIPVVVIDDPATAVPLARALVTGGVAIIEVTLRTPRALDAVAASAWSTWAAVRTEPTPRAISGTSAAMAAGADFLVSPGTSPALLGRLVAVPVPVLPGVATVSEVLTALDHGLSELKFFPAGPAGGPAYLTAIGGPVPQVRFCPTGGVTAANLRDYLAVPGVPTVGGTWLTPRSLIEAEDWAGITALATAAVTSGGTPGDNAP